MKNQNNDILKHLISDTELEKAPQDFTARVLGKVQQEQTESAGQGLLSPQQWLLIGLALGVAVIVMFSMDFGFLSVIFSDLDYRQLSEMLSTALINIKVFFKGLAMNSNVLVIFGSLILLIALDRILKKRFSFNLFTL